MKVYLFLLMIWESTLFEIESYVSSTKRGLSLNKLMSVMHLIIPSIFSTPQIPDVLA